MRLATLAAALALLGGSTTSIAAAPSCALSAPDRAWLDQAIAAWNDTRPQLPALAGAGPLTAVIFDARCVLISSSAMSGAPPAWRAAPHDGKIRLPDGAEISAGLISFAAPGATGSFFVMSTPSVWRAANVQAGAIRLDQMMIAVLLHEASHIAQWPPTAGGSTR